MSSPKYTITVSFKDNEKYMYDWIREHCSPGAAVKDVLKKHIEQERELKKPEQKRGLDLMDF
jgi:hypothetical protein